jgi:hypothetical protein
MTDARTEKLNPRLRVVIDTNLVVSALEDVLKVSKRFTLAPQPPNSG